ncbi:hypothetical protein G4Y79_04680 [Phototrophicus methaneseepsis]|jgi:hypothetical protein|uniref:Uncharacterized protein n=1 Tax=Phototrophicus methaneseepsis TaxID=2710758 RepID=A0A7S8IFK0_9CHLR|nr:hypothetical protein [Phototrophicus methaneseepsis]QPC83682.1 hypothetical protein G4Y79_04680 [Phototrophicus methaneseepsis]
MPTPQQHHPSFLLLRLLRVADMLVAFSDHEGSYPKAFSNQTKKLDAEENQPNDSAHPGPKTV